MSFPKEYPVLPRQSTLSQLPPEYPADAQEQIVQLLSTSALNRLVVLDDDPTGTQTCHDIPVLTVWDIPTLVKEFQQDSPGFFILTNSRALPPLKAEKLICGICENVLQAAQSTSQTVDIVLRGDSTLRGHFPLEADVAQSVFGPADAWVLAPFFFQGGRFTINDVHYVAEGDNLVPAGLTQFAKDATFGYKSSNLRDYVMEKAPGRFRAEQLHSITIDDIRKGGPDAVYEKLMSFPKEGVVIVNAAAESDMHVFVAGLLLGTFNPSSLTRPSFNANSQTERNSRKPRKTLPLPHRRSLRLLPPRNPPHPTHNSQPARPPHPPQNRRPHPRRLLRPQNNRPAQSPNRHPRPGPYRRQRPRHHRNGRRGSHRLPAERGERNSPGSGGDRDKPAVRHGYARHDESEADNGAGRARQSGYWGEGRRGAGPRSAVDSGAAEVYHCKGKILS